jgi:exopolysaccharide biosynthesis polyprenyl glycosylphosphotransferase
MRTAAESTGPAAARSPELRPALARRRRAAREQHLRRLLLAADVASGTLAGLVGALAAGTRGHDLALVAAVVACIWPAVAGLCGLYGAVGLRLWASGAGEIQRLVVAALLVSWPLFGLLHAVDAPDAAAGALVGAAAAGCIGGLCRAVARVQAHRMGRLRERTLVVGSGEVARQIVYRIRAHRELGLDPIGFVDDDVHRADELAVPHLGSLASLAELVASAAVDRVVIAFTRGSHEQLLACVRACRSARVPVDVVPRLFELMDGALAIDQIGGLPLVSVRPPSLSRGASIQKRVLDLVGACVALVVMAPLLIAIAIAVRLDSPGPAIFRQQRSGRDGRFFTLYKFRSMRSDAKVLVQRSGAIVKDIDDARLTRVGRAIRRYSLDEAPQLLNVLKGDMSLVGPRPLVRAEQEALTEEWQAERAELRPGLTGLWQISGRSHIPFEDMIKLDYQYAVGWTLARDIEILIATVAVVVTGRGAY